MSEKNANLQCLRAIGMLLVFFSHLGEFVNAVSWWGGFGVSLFFVLSGFLVCERHLYDDYEKNNRLLLVDGFKYAFSKAKKLAPLYFIMLVGSIPRTLYVSKAYSLSEILNDGLIQKFIANLFFVQSWIPRADYAISFNWPCWFLSTLMVFYILTPVLMKLIVKASTRNALIMGASIWGIRIIISLLCSNYETQPYDGFYYWIYISPESRIVDFVCGMVLCKYLHGREKKKHNIFVFEIIGLALFLLYNFLKSEPLVPSPFGYTELYIPLSIILIYVFVNAEHGKIVKLFFINDATKLLGDISSDFYIIHRMALCYFAILVRDHWIAKVFGAPALGSPVNVFLVMVAFVSVIVACLLWKKISKHISTFMVK